MFIPPKTTVASIVMTVKEVNETALSHVDPLTNERLAIDCKCQEQFYSTNSNFSNTVNIDKTQNACFLSTNLYMYSYVCMWLSMFGIFSVDHVCAVASEKGGAGGANTPPLFRKGGHRPLTF